MGGVLEGVDIMKKILTCAALAAGALALTACGEKKEEAPAAEPTAMETMAAETPAAMETPAADPAEAAAAGNDPTNNPIPPAAGEAAPAAN
jgi:hypothetical protein